MINTTEEKILLESDEPAFMVLGATSYETPGDTPDTVKKTTIFTIRFNEAMADKLNELGNRFYDADNDSKEEDEDCYDPCSDEGEQKDKERDAFLQNLGLTVLRYSNRDIHKNFRGVCEDIYNKISPYINT